MVETSASLGTLTIPFGADAMVETSASSLGRFTIFFGAVCLVVLLILVIGLVATIFLSIRHKRAARKGASAVIHSCPSHARWRDWLGNRLTGAARTDLPVHPQGSQKCHPVLDDPARSARGSPD